MPLTLYNTLTRSMEPLTPSDPSRIRFYSCGPTVYDDQHIGNFRTFLAADVLRRFLESDLCEVTARDGAVHRGPRTVVHVMNITDVGHMTDDGDPDGGGEDKMVEGGRRLKEAKKSGTLPEGVDLDPNDPWDIAGFFRDRFVEDARALGLKVAIEAEADPSLMPRATDSVPGMIRVIERLVERGHAYVAGNAVYFDVSTLPHYGKLSGNTVEHLREGEGGRVTSATQQEKRHPADFLLWKQDEAHLMKWESPWGVGYPGWHIECTAMAFERLVRAEGLEQDLFEDGAPLIDIHSGGEDNIFPHHECEIAQSCGAFNATPDEGSFASMWFHSRYLLVDGGKMSKSRGTFHTPRQLFADGHQPGAVRLALINSHYRRNADFSMQSLKDAARMLDRWETFRQAAESGPEGETNTVVRDEFARTLHDDLNIAGAIGVVNKWMNEIGTPTKVDGALLGVFDSILGVLERERLASRATEIALYQPGVEPSEEVEGLLRARAEARASKDWARADEIRDTLTGMGLAIKDAPGGRVEVGRHGS